MIKKLGSYVNGNFVSTIYSDGTKVRENDLEFFKSAFPENIDIKISNRCDMGCPMCHEKSTINGKNADLKNLEFIDTLRPYTELAIGGGNIFENPQLEAFLLKLKDRKIIANITVNQKHFMDNLELLKTWQEEKLFYGIGISLVDSNEKFLDEVEKFPNAVIHVINGVVTPAQLFSISHKTFKILILGYKDFGRGTNYHLANSYEINKNMDFLYYNLEFIRNNVKVLSFDNLAITQLDPKRLLTEEQYKEFYMGDDGQFTMYIDAVERKFAKNSTATVRYDLTDNIDGMFQIIKGEI